MKRFISILTMVFALTLSISAQKQTTQTKYTTTYTQAYDNAESRMAQVLVQPLVKPLVCEVEVVPSKPTSFKLNLTKTKVEKDLEGNLTNVHNYGIFKYTEATQTDMIVAATYHLYSTDDGDYVLEIKGFPAKFKNWHTATNSDYEWMRITGAEGAGNQTITPIVKK
ncbi:MAG: hypothetical protein MJZ32_09235 [Bacteroidaceae bacterium]|nr:hypothetical protein [Bacteroidaceae bacterium]